MKMFRRILLFRQDFFDRSAKTWRSRSRTIEIAKIALPAIAGAITTFSNIVERLGGGLPALFFVPIYLICGVVLSTWIIIEKKAQSVSSRGTRTFRFPQELRQPSKFSLLFFILMTIVSIVNLLPNLVRKDRSIEGVLCSAKHEPISRATVTAIDRFGQTSSVDAELTDDEGYFFLDLSALAQPPTEISVSFGRCMSVRVPISAGLLSANGCRHSAVPSHLKIGQKIWVVTCQN